MMRALVRADSGQKRESEREFASILKAHPDDPVPHLYIGLAEFERRSYADAKAHFDRAGALAMDNPDVLPAVVETYLALRDFSLPDRLLKQMEQTARPDPDLLFQLGSLLIRYGSYDRAIGAVEKLSATAPAKPEALLMLADAYDCQAMPEKAYGAYQKAISIQPGLRRVMSRLPTSPPAMETTNLQQTWSGRDCREFPDHRNCCSRTE